jgi:CspA family cold shock protein
MSNTQATSSSADRITGQVKWFNTKAGYGFITVCDGENVGKDIFVHYSSLNVANSQYRYLVQGEYVEFGLIKPENDKYEYHATAVGGVKGGLIMCETRRIAAETQPVRSLPERTETVRRYRTPNDSSDNVRQERASRPRVTRQEPAQRQESAQTSDDTGFQRVSRKKAPSRAKPSA